MQRCEFYEGGKLAEVLAMAEVDGVVTCTRTDAQGNVLESWPATDAERVAYEEARAEARAETIRARIADALATLETADEQWDALTTAQKLGALRLSVRVTAGLARLALRRLDAS